MIHVQFLFWKNCHWQIKILTAMLKILVYCSKHWAPTTLYRIKKSQISLPSFHSIPFVSMYPFNIISNNLPWSTLPKCSPHTHCICLPLSVHTTHYTCVSALKSECSNSLSSAYCRLPPHHSFLLPHHSSTHLLRTVLQTIPHPEYPGKLKLNVLLHR